MPSILFVCTANRFRSPLAAALLRKKMQGLGILDSWQISSAGTWTMPGQPALPEVLAAAQRFNIDLSNHRSTRVDRKILSAFDLILVMEASQKEALQTEFPELQHHIYLFSDVVERRAYDITDTLRSENDVVRIMNELESLLRRGLESICVLATYLHNSRRTDVSP